MKPHKDITTKALNTFKDLEERFKYIHQDKYDYRECIYLNNRTPLKIYCKQHNEYFMKSADNHLKGQGCPLCAKEIKGQSNRMTTAEFISKAKLIHNNLYDYSEVEYKGSMYNVKIYCNTHKQYFWQRAGHHLSGSGCLKCFTERASDLYRSNIDEFIEKASIKHNNKYDYSKVDYINSKTKVKIICPIHGEFLQDPSNHLTGNACPICGSIKSKKKYYNEPTLIYYIRLRLKDKVWYKIGITTKAVLVRFRKESHLNIEIINTKTFDSGKPAYELEQQILKEFNHLITQDSPLIKGGNSEIFDQDIYQHIQHHFI